MYVSTGINYDCVMDEKILFYILQWGIRVYLSGLLFAGGLESDVAQVTWYIVDWYVHLSI